MRTVRLWERGEFSLPRPLCFSGQPRERERPSSFPFKQTTFAPGGHQYHARLHYRLGWTALVLWNTDVYFADEILTFDGMMELVRQRFPDKFYLQARIEREYVD